MSVTRMRDTALSYSTCTVDEQVVLRGERV